MFSNKLLRSPKATRKTGTIVRLFLERLEDRTLPSLVMLASFNGSNGAYPNDGLINDSTGNLFGTAEEGGASGYGTVLEVAAGSGTITTLASFNGSNGRYPLGRLVENSSGNLFGTAEQGGAFGVGTVLEVAAGSGSITTLASFNGSNGALPIGALVEDSSGNLFGTTKEGGASRVGTVFEVVAGSGSITTLASFNGSNGALPGAGLVEDSSGNLFGNTTWGGPSYTGGETGDGTVFEVAAGSGSITTLASFNGSNGALPYSSLVEDSGGNLFGTTYFGGAPGNGTVFEVAAGSGSITTLASFNGSNGAYPSYGAGLVEDSSGNLFGTTSEGGPSYTGGYSGNGTVFEVAAGSGSITTLASFNGSNGAYPNDGLVEDSSGNLFGMTAFGGPSGYGTVFKVTATSITITSPSVTYGSNAQVTVAVTSIHGGTPTGNVSLTVDNGLPITQGLVNGASTFTLSGLQVGIHSLSASYSAQNGFAAASGTGTLPVNPSLSLVTLAFFNGANGSIPVGGLVEDSSGNLFGTTYSGGASGNGTVFEVAAGSGSITTLASFNGSNGDGPEGALVEDSSGNLFGTTYSGGASGNGTVFEVAAGSGSITTLASFNGSNGAYTSAGLVEDSSGNLFGATTWGGIGFNGNYESGNGTVFEVAAGSGSITTLATFNGSNGANPYGGLVEDSGGNLFGTTYFGGAAGDGTVFEVAAGSGSITTLATFNGSNGAYPSYGGAGLVEDSSGNLFGTASFGGPGYTGGYSGNGTVFEVAAGSGSITTLATFSGSNGETPNAGLVEDSSGNLFGTTIYGGSSYTGGYPGYGTVFEVAAGSGSITTLASFNGSDGAYPDAGPVEDSSGNLFGTTPWGGPNYTGGYSGNGTVFEVTAADSLVVTAQPPSTVVAGAPFEVTVAVEGADGKPDPNYNGTVSISLANNPGGATLGGTLTVQANQGVANFPDLTLDQPGQGYTLQVTSDSGLSATTNPFTVNNVPPTTSISTPLDGFQGVSGQARGFMLGATDPSPVDQAAGFTYAVNWGDGLSNQYTGPDGTAASHVYATPGNYTVSVTATDMDGLTSPVATENLTILTTEQQGAELAVGGKPGNDAFVLTAGPGTGKFQVQVNGQTEGIFQATGGVHVYGESGINSVTVIGTTSGDQFTIDPADIVLNGITIDGDNINRWIANGRAGDDTFTFAGNSMDAAATIHGSGGNNTLYAPTLASNQSNTWTINGTNTGTLNGASWSFSGIQNLVGGANDDLFQFVGAGRVTGNINGAGAFSAAGNTLDYTGYTGASTVTVNLANGKATAIGGSFSNIETALGQTSTASDTLIGANTTNAWAISGANSGTVNSFNFLGFGNLTGGAGADTFTVGSNGSLTGRLDGGSGRNMIVGPNLADTFNITANNAGNLNTSVIPSFIRIQNLTGGGQPTSFVFGAGMSVTGNINGGTGGGTLNYQNYSTNVSVNLQTSRATGVGGAAINLVGVTGGSGNNTLRGANTASTWNITANNAGNINGAFTFTGFANLKGGTGTNDFVFSDQQGVTGTIDGGGGSNRLDYSAYSTGLYVNLRTGVATGTGGIENFKQVFGGNGNDILVGMGSGILLEEGTGNDLIIGGSGQATIQSGSGQDIVIAGSTTYDNNQAALQAIEDYWSTNGGTFAQRVAGLSSGITGGYQLNSSTVKHHGGSGDTIALGSANDWLFWRMVGSGKDTLTGTPGQSTLI